MADKTIIEFNTSRGVREVHIDFTQFSDKQTMLELEVPSLMKFLPSIKEQTIRETLSRSWDLAHDDKIAQKNKAMMRKKVFIVHGRDRSMRDTVSEYVKSLALEPVILFKQTNKGKTIIEKIERCADECSYAIVLLSPDDYGGLKGDMQPKLRARQNVVLELGYMWGKLGRDKVAMLYRNDVEKPSDADGIVHIPYYRKSGWREQLKKELEDAGLFSDTHNDEGEYKIEDYYKALNW